ncbi:MAG: hypothetical protein ABL916_19115 [Burkholderiaceae bacterium]
MTMIPPPWAQATAAPAAAEVPRAPDGRFVAGHTGNPAGRPVGIVDRRNRVAKAFDAEFDAIGAALVERAKGGDVGAIALYLSRVEPPLRPKGERTPFVLDTTQPLAVQAAQVVQAVADGHLSADDAQTVLACLNTYAQLAQHDQLEARLQALERATRARGRAPGHGGVMYVEHPPGTPQ